MLDFDDGVHLIGTGIFLDPRRKRERAIVTHAHSDHVGRHRRWVASPPTAALCAARWGAQDVEAHAFHESWEDDGARLTLLPAGHILGSAMVLVERAGTRILYTGDFRLRPSATAERCTPAAADVLVMECTFGDPRYRFPDRQAELDRLCGFIARTRATGSVPVLFAYSLGKAQEVACLLSGRGVPTALNEEAWTMADVYRRFGVTFPDSAPYTAGDTVSGALLLPPGPGARPLLRGLGRKRTALVSGWALDPWRRMPFAQEGFAISDHADFDELIEMVEAVKPRKIHTLHGPDRFAAHLRARGWDAEAASVALQGSLF